MIEKIIIEKTYSAIEELFGQKPDIKHIQIQKTKKDFEGDFTLVVFPFLKLSKKSPEQTADLIGKYLETNLKEIESYNVIKGFLNLLISKNFWLEFFVENYKNSENFGFEKLDDSKPYVIEFSSPNTNKPLHLGHIRNNLIGYSVSKILQANGKNVVNVNLVNDRGIHICKSMLAWQKWGDEKTPETLGLKGDKFVGDFYVRFDKENKEEVKRLMNEGYSEDESNLKSPLIIEAQKMLKKWEKNDTEIRQLWERLNDWVYAGFDKTYKRLGIEFNKIYFESETYLLGKEIVEKGLKDGVLFKKDDGSVWADLTSDGLDEKLLLRSDGTSVYMTQDLGTAKLRHDEYLPEKLIYVVGNEQNYHFNVLELILKKLGYNWADCIKHLSYGMVELPHGKMKSREGTVVDADDLMEEMFITARETTKSLGKIDGFSETEANNLFETIGMGALKYFILKVDPKKNMTFNPVESIDFTGNTGPFIQYTSARIKSVLRKASEMNFYPEFSINSDINLLKKEKDVIKLLFEYPLIIKQAGENLSPAMIANYAYDLVKEYNQFYQEVPILKDENKISVEFRLALSEFVSNIIKSSMELLGILVPDRM
ncbi:MAG: arginine--tRNA ligase [Bacteroidales bacterium]|nr:arginine--tRNA ligase [Bacteroidales bacterium]